MVHAGLIRLLRAANRPVDAASLAAFRIAFGFLMFVAAVRFFTHGWIAADYVVPKVFFHYWGFGWVRPWPGGGMYVHYAIIAASALFVAFGRWFRPACIVFALTFTYAHLCDKSNYLNHYYLVSLLAFLLAVLPIDLHRPQTRRWVLWVLRFQVGVVYVFGGIAKLGSDWLVHGEPLRIWLAANAEMPLLGRLFSERWFAIGMSWGGMLFDLSIVPLLSWRKTRPYAYLVACMFHTMTAMLFEIGMFPWIMTSLATIFFHPSWPRRFVRRVAPSSVTPSGPQIGRLGVAAFAVYAFVQLVVPLRHVVYPGNTLWTEEGFRFAWRVMLIEKSGALELTVVDREGHRTLVEPKEYLTPFQARMASTQPDMILELAHVVAKDFEARTGAPVAVYADAQVSFNGRRRARMIDPDVDLASEDDSLAPKRWILSAPATSPEF